MLTDLFILAAWCWIHFLTHALCVEMYWRLNLAENWRTNAYLVAWILSEAAMFVVDCLLAMRLFDWPF
ncbi:hypothetical protein LTR85_009021 [Meristemomyces frigidus]|nr:hypothetical protein LTR85_009021 [Meristemomyces frigidus]